jgi:hypothetical protein
MADGLPPRPGALKQIYEIAAERWQHWDSRRKKSASPGRSARGARGSREESATPQEQGQSVARARSSVTAAERRRAQRLRQQGYSLRAISELLSRPISTVRRLVSEADADTTVSRAELQALDNRVTRIEHILAALGRVLQGLDSDSAPRRRRAG